jgi:DNA processing protein
LLRRRILKVQRKLITICHNLATKSFFYEERQGMQSSKHLINNAIPGILRRIATPPQDLYIMGPLDELLKRPRLSVVGTRKPSPYGKQVTQTLVQELANQGIVIISGLAFGVDALAHQACLEAGGQTIAVLPGSLDTIYPTAHHRLAKRILEQGGALVSEYPAGSIAYKLNFVSRNRLVSGLGDGVLIIEAADKSGTIHTASFALDQGKTVMAVPGNITSPLSVGTNRLLKVGATPVTSSNDVREALGLGQLNFDMSLIQAANNEEAVLLDLLRQGISDGSQLQSVSSLPPPLFNQTLTMLEITGKIRPLGAGHYRLQSI